MSRLVAYFSASGSTAKLAQTLAAAADSWFSHLAIEVSGENASNEWLESVSQDDYNKLK